MSHVQGFLMFQQKRFYCKVNYSGETNTFDMHLFCSLTIEHGAWDYKLRSRNHCYESARAQQGDHHLNCKFSIYLSHASLFVVIYHTELYCTVYLQL